MSKVVERLKQALEMVKGETIVSEDGTEAIITRRQAGELSGEVAQQLVDGLLVDVDDALVLASYNYKVRRITHRRIKQEFEIELALMDVTSWVYCRQSRVLNEEESIGGGNDGTASK